MSNRPLTYGETEDALEILKNTDVIHSGYWDNGLRIQSEDGDSFKHHARDGIESLLKETGADPDSVFDYHTRPERPDPSTALVTLEKRSTFTSPNRLFHTDAESIEELERTDVYRDASQMGTYHYANSDHKGIIAARVRGGTLSIGYIPVEYKDHEQVEGIYYPFRDMHSTDHLWAFLHDFTNAAPFYGNPDERFIEVWSRCLVAIENDLFA